jgi:hypothetical protein
MSELTREQIEETTRDLLSLFGVQNPRDIESRKRIIAIRKLALAALERGVWVPRDELETLQLIADSAIKTRSRDVQDWIQDMERVKDKADGWLSAAPVSYDELEFTTDQPISPATPQTDK